MGMRWTTPRSLSRLPQAISDAPSGSSYSPHLAVEHQLVEGGLYVECLIMFKRAQLPLLTGSEAGFWPHNLSTGPQPDMMVSPVTPEEPSCSKLCLPIPA